MVELYSSLGPTEQYLATIVQTREHYNGKYLLENGLVFKRRTPPSFIGSSPNKKKLNLGIKIAFKISIKNMQSE